jgi:predicted RNA-binding protein associated with RNAse of E/G family
MKNKQEMIQLIKGVFAIETNKEATEKFNELEIALTNELVTEGGYKLAGVTVEAVEKKASSGVTKLGGEEKAWSKPAHVAPKAKFTKEIKEAVYREL